MPWWGSILLMFVGAFVGFYVRRILDKPNEKVRNQQTALLLKQNDQLLSYVGVLLKNVAELKVVLAGPVTPEQKKIIVLETAHTVPAHLTTLPPKTTEELLERLREAVMIGDADERTYQFGRPGAEDDEEE